jgi:acetyl esterase/lipase
MHRVRYLAVLAILFGLSGVLMAQDPLAPYEGSYGSLETDNIVYGSGAVNGGAGSLALTLDMFQPTNIGVPVPAVTPGIILIHGGSFVDGDKSDLDYLAQIYATHGYTAVSIDYRLIGNNPPLTAGPANFANFGPATNAVNVAVQDAQTAMGWMRGNAAAYGIDAGRVAIGGFSAGAITALMEAYNSPPATYAPTAVLDFSGGMYGSESTIHAGAPPAFVFHGTADPTVPYVNATNLVNQLNAVGVYNFFQPWVGGDHEIDLNAVDADNGETMYQNNIDFLNAELLDAPEDMPPAVPEPSSVLLLGIGCVALLQIARRRAARAAVARP